MIEEDAKHKTLVTMLSPKAWKIIFSLILISVTTFYIHSCNLTTEKNQLQEEKRLSNRSASQIMQEEGARACRNAIRNQTNYNVNFVFGGTSTMSSNNSFTIMNIETFTKNAFGQKVSKRYFCKLSIDANKNITVKEIR